MKAHLAFNVLRRFFVIQAQLLFFKQQRMTMLEKQLEKLDLQNLRLLYFDSFQTNANVLRRKVFKDFDKALRDYNKLYV